MLTLVEHCEQLKAELSSDKLTKRKEGLKHLNQVLDSEALVNALDDATLRVRSTDRHTVDSWPGLCTILVQCLAKELGTSSGKKRGQEVFISKTFKRFVQTADDERRSGRNGMLGRRAPKLFAHVKDVLNRAGLTSSFGADYSSVLRSNLLVNPDYCSSVPATTIQELLSIYLAKLEDAPIDRCEETYRTISTVHLLLQSFHGDMDPAFREDMVVFLCEMFPKLHELREDSRISTAFVASMNTFLLAHGLDVCSKAAELHAAVHPFLMRALRSARDARLREALVLYLRIQLLLKGLEASGEGQFLEEVQDLLTHSAQQSGFTWTDEGRGRGCVPSKQQLSLLELTASVTHKLLLQRNAAACQVQYAQQSSSKRRKVSSPQEHLVEQLIDSPHIWAPVVSLLLRRHGSQMDEQCYSTWLQLISKIFVDVSKNPLAGKATDLATLWLLRFLSEFAAAWPQHCQHSALSASLSVGKPSFLKAAKRTEWQVIWDALVRWLSQSEDPSSPELQAAQAAAMLTLAHILRKDLASFTSSASSLFRLPMLQQNFPSNIVFIYSRFAAVYRGGAEEVALRSELLTLILTDRAVATTSAKLLYRSVAGLLGLLSDDDQTAASNEEESLMWWHQESGDKSVDEQLQCLIRGEEFVRRRTKAAQITIQQAESGKQAMPESVAARLQNIAGTSLAAALGKLSEHASNNESQLQGLLGLCTTALRCNILLLERAYGNDAKLEPTWRANGALSGALGVASQKCSSLLVALVDSRSSLTSETYSLLEEMVSALSLIPVRQGLASSWLGAIHELERLFNDANQAAAARLLPEIQSASGSACAVPAPALIFDDDLDLHATAAAAANGRPASAGPSSFAGLVATCRATCVRLLAVLGSLHAEVAVNILGTFLEHCFNADVAPPKGLTELIAEKLCSVAAVSRLPRLIQVATSGLDANAGLLLSKKFDKNTIIIVLKQLEVLVHAYGDLKQTASDKQEVERCLEGFIVVLEAALDLIIQADERSSASCSATHVALARAVVAVMRIAEVTKLSPELLDDCLAQLANLLQDHCYAARRHAATMIPLLYSEWSDAQAIFDSLKPKLSLHSLTTSSHHRSVEQMETSALFLGETAVASGALEVEAIFLLCAHAAKFPQHQSLVQAVLLHIGQRLGYSSLPAYMSNHMTHLVFLWFGRQYQLQDFLNIHELLTVQEGSDSNQKAFLASYSRALVPAMLMDNREEELRQMAGLLGVDLRKLLERNMDAIMGTTYPLTKTGEESDRALAKAILEENIMAEVFTGSERNAMFGNKIINIIGQMLLLVRECAHPPKPFFTVAVAIEAINSVPSFPSRKECQKILWSQILSDDATAKLLLMVHVNLQKGCCARHLLEGLGPLKALLTILDGHVCTSHTFRHVVHILLQCLRVRELQGKCCRLLEDVLERMQGSTDLLSLLGTYLPTIISGAVTALETTSTAPEPLNREGGNKKKAGDQSAAQPNKLVALINKLILQALPSLHPYLKHVEPLPALPDLALAQQLLDGLRSGVSLSAELTHFVSRAAALPAVLLQRALASLNSGLSSRQSELIAPDGPRPCKPEVEQAAWQLVWLSRDLGDNDLAAFTGKLLALVGPLDPNVIAFSIPSSAASSPAAPAEQPARSSKGVPPATAAAAKVDSLQGTLTEALQLLIVYLVDEDVPFIQTVHVSLRRLLSTPKGHAAMQQLEPLQQSYIQVFAGQKRAASSPEAGTRVDLEDSKLWQLEGQSYEQWVCGLADALLSHACNPLLTILQRCARKKPAMAELLLPHIFVDLAANDADASLMLTISEQVSKHIVQDQSADMKAVRLILNVLNFLRNEQQDSLAKIRPRGKSGQSASDVADPTMWSKVCWLNVDYLQVAEAALRCSAAFTALLYIEYWCKNHYGRLTLGEEDLLSQGGLSAVDQLLLDIYSQIQEPDGIYAAARSQKAASQLHLFEHEGSWDKALVGYDLLQLGDRSALSMSGHQLGLLNSLQQLGCQHTLSAYWASMPQASHAGSRAFWEKRFEAAWRMGDWQEASQLQPPLPDAGETVPFHQAICFSLKALKDEDRDTLCSTLNMARAAIVQELATISTESAASINPAVVRLQMLDCLADGFELQGQATFQQPGAGGRYELIEPLLSLQRTLASALDLPDAAASILLQRARAARKDGRLTHTMGSLHDLQTLSWGEDPSAFGGQLVWRMEEAKLMWAQGQHGMAIRLGQVLLKRMLAAPNSDAEQLTRLQSLLGKWLAWNRSESSAAVLDMMQQALERVACSGSQALPEGKVACRAAYRLAHYADSMYCSLQEQRNSPEWATAQAVIQQKMQQMAQWQAQFDERRRRGEMKIGPDGTVLDKESRQLWHHINSLKRPVEADKQEQAALTASELKYRDIAMTNYRRCLLAGNAYNLPVVFRLCQLWFSLGADREVAQQMSREAAEVPSWKFMPLVYQLASRLSRPGRSRPLDESGFTDTLAKLMERLAAEHPHHTLHCLMALKNGNRGRDGRPTAARASRDALVHSVDFDKVAAAEAVLDNVARKSTALKEIVAQVDQIAEAYIELATMPAPDKANEMPFPSHLRRSTKALHKVPVVSTNIPVDPSCRYSGLACFSHFGEGISFVGGINKPKLVQCFDSEGVRHRQLVKSGNDDLRQDAVMQQFFSLINDLLAQSVETRKRCLNIVTYKVVPFSPAAGLLEWVEETVPLGTYLTGKERTSGAHARYARPGDYSFYDAYNHIFKCKPQNLRRAFNDVCEHFTPCLHNFFLECFRQPAAWFEKRLAYTRATAVNSMAGYLIGLGDRHFHNILIDKRSAEVVHIDLGVAFEQGRFLNTPELVPFRLTRDVVDGMGATGVEGVMRKCCEETLRVLREHKESLLTIVEVFIHDPLYRWALTPAIAHQRQVSSLTDAGAAGLPELDQSLSGSGDQLANADAKRTLLRVKQKLEGLDGGEGEAKSVEGQVQQLLQEAQDPDRLCRMFVGWAPWL